LGFYLFAGLFCKTAEKVTDGFGLNFQERLDLTCFTDD